jgi:hypothetical protein
MENIIEVNGMDEVVKMINDSDPAQEFIINVDCFEKDEDK